MTSAPVADPRTEEHLLEEFEAERPGRKLHGVASVVVNVLGAGLVLFAIYWVLQPDPRAAYRPAFLAVALLLTFLVFRGHGRSSRAEHPEECPTALDWVLGIAGAGRGRLRGGQRGRGVPPGRRAGGARHPDGVLSIALVLEATRRTVGWILPAICLGFIAYAYLGGLIPESLGIAHKGYGLDRIVGMTYMGLEGLFGIPLDVAATYIVLFTFYGAVLEYSGAARFFVQLSYAAFGRCRTGPGRTTTLAGFLLGTVSGSGVATTVTLGSVTWPLLRKAGYPKESGGGVLAASGIGAILSPPTLGAAAFIIAEFLEESYFKVLLYATVPSLLYYLGVLLAIEADARRFRVQGIALDTPGFWRLLGRWGYHFSSLIAIVVLLAMGMSPFRAVLYATVLAFLMSFLDRRDWMGPREVGGALVSGARGVLPIAATSAAAGIIVAVVSLDRPRARAVGPDRRRGRRVAGADRDLQRDRRAHPRPGRAGHGLVHHRRGHHRAGADRARGRAVRRLHVHLLLRGAERGEPADRAVGFRGGGDHRRRRLQDDDADRALHAARVPRAVRVHADGERPGAAAPGRPRDDPARGRRLGDRCGRAGGRARRLAARARWRCPSGSWPAPARSCCSTSSRCGSASGSQCWRSRSSRTSYCLAAWPAPRLRTTVRDALDSALIALTAAGCDTPRLDAEVLLAAAMGVDRAVLISDPERGVEPEPFREYVQRRARREPVAYILGRKGFRRLELEVDPRVLIPRPETEHVVEAALSLPHGVRVVDVGTGSGAIALALADERPDLRVVGTESSPGALAVARANAERLGLDVELLEGDLLEPVTGPVDAVVCNPPYVPAGARLAPELAYEPAEALYADPRGPRGLSPPRPRAARRARSWRWRSAWAGRRTSPRCSTATRSRSCPTSPASRAWSWRRRGDLRRVHRLRRGRPSSRPTRSTGWRATPRTRPRSRGSTRSRGGRPTSPRR